MLGALSVCSFCPLAGSWRAFERSLFWESSDADQTGSKKELKLVYGVPYSFGHIARLEVAGLFPKRVRLGACRVAWIADEVQNWIDERIAKRDRTLS